LEAVTRRKEDPVKRGYNFMVDFEVPKDASEEQKRVAVMMKAADAMKGEDLIAMDRYAHRVGVSKWVKLPIHLLFVNKLLALYKKHRGEEGSITARMVQTTTENVVGIQNYLQEHVIFQNKQVPDRGVPVSTTVKMYLEMVGCILEGAFDRGGEVSFVVSDDPYGFTSHVHTGVVRDRVGLRLAVLIGQHRPALEAVGGMISEIEFM
jgi:hypothetical protein